MAGSEASSDDDLADLEENGGDAAPVTIDETFGIHATLRLIRLW